MAIPEGFKTKSTIDTQRRCIYFPNVGEVYKTSYRKGVIKEFKKLQDDPIKVAPSVKVEVDGNSSDFIPIFFKPKEKYWDTADAGAQDFDEDNGSYKNAWMSFRGDDEVIVQCYEDKPVAVVGFADGIPRIGEDVIYVTGSTIQTEEQVEQWQRMSSMEEYPDEDKGPDGKDLILAVECEEILAEESKWSSTPVAPELGQPGWYLRSLDVWWSGSITEIFWEGPDWYWPGNWLTMTGIRTDIYRSDSAVYQYDQPITHKVGKTNHYLVKVGAILYCYQALTRIEEKQTMAHFYDFGATGPSYVSSAEAFVKYTSDGVMGHFEWDGDPEKIANVYAAAAGGSSHYEYEDPPPAPCSWDSTDWETGQRIHTDHCVRWGDAPPFYALFAAPYTKELYDEVKGGAVVNYPSSEFIKTQARDVETDFPKKYAGMFRQTGAGAIFNDVEFTDPGRAHAPWWEDSLDNSTLTFSVRPHTKEEIESLLGVKNG